MNSVSIRLFVGAIGNLRFVLDVAITPGNVGSSTQSQPRLMTLMNGLVARLRLSAAAFGSVCHEGEVAVT
jgi:hypothetical protein